MQPAELMEPGVTLRGITKTFGVGKDAITALEQVDLCIADGEFVAIVGPSGCGKSTLMRLISRLAHPSSGEIEVFGDRSSLPPPGMSIVFQSHVLLGWRTILEN